MKDIAKEFKLACVLASDTAVGIVNARKALEKKTKRGGADTGPEEMMLEAAKEAMKAAMIKVEELKVKMIG